MNFEVIAFVLYFIIVLGIGIFFFLRSKGAGEKDYFLGGRSMGPWVTAMSAQASDMSAWLLMGLPGSILAFGLGQVWIGIGLGLGTIANWIFVAKRLRRFSKASNDAITLPQYLTNRFAAQSPALQIICAVIFLICFTIYVASAFVAGATVFVTVFPDLPMQTAMLIFALIIIIYTFLGGYKAVCWTDFFQGLLMLVALLAVHIIVALTQNLDTAALSTVYTNAADGTEYVFGTSVFGASIQDILSGLAWGLGYFGMPHILVRFMSIEKPSMVKKSATVAIIWVVITLAAACVIAYFGRMVLAEELLPAGLQKNVFIAFSRMLFPPIISGLLLAAIIAASMSTADSQLLSAASAFSENMLGDVFGVKLNAKQNMLVARLTVVVIAVVAVFLATDPNSSVFRIVSFAWAGFGATFGPAILFALFWKRSNRQGVLAGLIAGGAMVFIWKFGISKLGGAFAIYELLPAFVFAAIVTVIVSLATPAPEAELVEVFDEMNAK